jgi:hypothetical protein
VELILAICDRFHCLPSQVLAEDASILRLVSIEALAKPDDDGEVPDGGW